MTTSKQHQTYFLLVVLLTVAVANGQDVQVSVQSDGPSVLIESLGNVTYVQITAGQSARIQITCTKVNASKAGTLFAFVNTQTTSIVGCANSTPPQFFNNSAFCAQRLFSYDLTIEAPNTNIFLVQCGIQEESFSNLQTIYLPKLCESPGH
jgi:hypothetical protein